MTSRLIQEWKNRAEAEYRSAAITAQLAHWCIQSSISEPLVKTALRIVSDELDHASLSFDCLEAFAGPQLPSFFDARQLAEPIASEGILASLLDSLLRNFCLGETYAVPLFAAMRAGTTVPAAKEVLDRVLKDEAVHRAFGWELLDELLEFDQEGVRARAAQVTPLFLSSFQRGYGTLFDSAPLTDVERAWGMISIEEYVMLFEHTTKTDIIPRFLKRGISFNSIHGAK